MSEVYVYCGPALQHGSTEEFVPGSVCGDFTPAGELIGVEVLGAARVTVDGVDATARIAELEAEVERLRAIVEHCVNSAREDLLEQMRKECADLDRIIKGGKP